MYMKRESDRLNRSKRALARMDRVRHYLYRLGQSA